MVDTAQDFVILKATEGTKFVDPDCDNKYQRAKSKGKLVGVYAFADMTDPVAEANYFVNNIQGYLGEALLALDMETHADPAWALTFLQTVYNLTRVRPLVYMSASTTTAADWSQVASDYALWCAGYPASFNVVNPPRPAEDGSDMPYKTGAWPFATIWQYSSSAGTLDRDIAYMSQDAWAKFAQGDRNAQPTQNPQPTPDPQTTTPDPTDPAPASPPVQPTPAPLPETPQPASGQETDPTEVTTHPDPAPVEANPPQTVDTPSPHPVVVTTKGKQMNKLTSLWLSIPENFRHVLHTAWQVAIPVLLTHLYMARSSKDVQAAVMYAGAVFLAALKAAVVKY